MSNYSKGIRILPERSEEDYGPKDLVLIQQERFQNKLLPNVPPNSSILMHASSAEKRKYKVFVDHDM